MDAHTEVVNERAVRALGVMIVVASIIQMGVASEAFQVMSYGAWWAGMFVFITGVLAICTTSRVVAAIGLSSSIVSIILCMVGMTWDSTGFLLHELDTCKNPLSGNLYGDESNDGQIDVLCYEASDNRDCWCMVEEDAACYTFNVQASDKDCDPLMTTVPPLLIASFYFLLAMLLMSCCYSCCMCKTICCHNSAAVVPVNYDHGQAISMQAPAFIPPQYVQPHNPAPSVDTNIYTATVITEPHTVDEMRKGNPGGTYSMAPIMAYAVAQPEPGQRQW